MPISNEGSLGIDALTRANDQISFQKIHELESTVKDLIEVLHIVSHDLHEPLRAVIGFGDLLQSDLSNGPASETQEYAKFMVDGARRMQGLLDDLLAYTRIDTHVEAAERVDLNVIAEESKKKLSAMIIEKKAHVQIEKLPTCFGVRSLLVQVFQNLIANAIRYHRKDISPEVLISAQFHPDQKIWEFLVKDNGIGIDSQYYARIFKIFQRLHTREEYPGNGVGLSVCKKIIERQGGKIWVESKVGEGSTFHFTLPNLKDEGHL